MLEGLRARGIPAVVGLVGSPRWANGGRTPNFAPGAPAFAAFARAAATRYRWVKQWLVWNEPNQARWLRPTTAAVYVRQLLNPAYAAIHAVIPRRQGGGRRHRPARIDRRCLTGRLDPRDAERAAPASTRTRTIRIPRAPARRRSPAGASHCATITMATLERLLSEVSRAFGPKRIWLTEYGYQTGAYGVSQQRQAELIGQSGLRVHKAPRVDMLIHYLVKDEPEAARFQSGLFQQSGRPKLAALAFPLPLAQAGRSGGKLVLWGQVRPRSGVQTFRVQVRTGGVWRVQRRRPQDRRRRVLQRRCARGSRDGRADLLAAGRRLQRLARRR